MPTIAPAIAPAIIATHALACHRGDALLLQNFSQHVAAGTGLWITGRNGAGKSTLLRVLAGLQSPLKGRVECAADFIYQAADFGFDPLLTLQENLLWWGACARRDNITPQKKSVKESLQQVGLPNMGRRFFAALSSGQQARAALARLCYAPAPLWLLDEPYARLDEAGEIMFNALLAQHLAQGGAAVIATHKVTAMPGMAHVPLIETTAIAGGA